MAGRPAKNHLPQPAVRVGAFDQQVRRQRMRLGQDRLADRSALPRLDGQRHRGDTVPAELRRQLIRPGAGDRPAFDRQHMHLLRRRQEGHGQGDGPRAFGAAVPGDDHGLADLPRRRRWRQHYRPAGIEQRGLQHRDRRRRRAVHWPADDDRIEQAAAAPDRAFAGAFLQPPSGADNLGIRHRIAQADAFVADEFLERLARLLGPMPGLALDALRCRERRAHALRTEQHIDRRQQIEAFDIAVEPLRHQIGGLEHRGQDGALLDRHQNVLHAFNSSDATPHTPPQFRLGSRRCVGIRGHRP